MTVKKLNQEVIESWPEIFEEINLKVVPIQYLCSVQVKFKDNRIWTIDVGPKLRDEVYQTIEENIQELIKNYKSHIESIDFKLDTDKIKHDITRETNKFLRKQRLT
jgi:site-specific DNA-adenine methylase